METLSLKDALNTFIGSNVRIESHIIDEDLNMNSSIPTKLMEDTMFKKFSEKDGLLEIVLGDSILEYHLGLNFDCMVYGSRVTISYETVKNEHLSTIIITKW